MNGLAVKILVGMLGALICWVAFEMIQSYAFRTVGERCPASRCNSIEADIEELKRANHNLQLQVEKLKR